MSFGPQRNLNRTAEPLRLTADGAPERPTGGLSIYWPAVPAATVETTYLDGTVVRVGEKALPVGLPIAKITSAESHSLVESGTPTGGNFDLIVTVDGEEETFLAVPFNVTAAALQTLFEGHPQIGAGNVTVGRTGTTSDFTWTVALQAAEIGTEMDIVVVNHLTGGTAPAVTYSDAAGGGTYGMYAAADTTATDGRQTLQRGSLYLIDMTVKEKSENIWGEEPEQNHPQALDGGDVFKARMLHSTNLVHPFTNLPTYANLLAALTRLRPIG